MYNTTLDIELLRGIKILAAQLEMRQNDLIEEAIRDLIEKYKHQELRVSNGWVALIFFVTYLLIGLLLKISESSKADHLKTMDKLEQDRSFKL